MSRKTQKEARKKLPSLEHRYNYRFKRRSTPEGIALEALGGDKHSISLLAGIGAVILSDHLKNDEHPTACYAFWLADILGQIQAGVEPNKAFGWGLEEGQWKLHNGETWDRLKKAYEVARIVETFASNVAGKSYAEAVEHAALVWGVTHLQCRKAILSATALNLRLSKTIAVEIACDLVSAFGASGHHGVSASTAGDYHKELMSSTGTS